MSLDAPPPWLRRLVVLGMGYTGTHVVRRLRVHGVDCVGTTRTPDPLDPTRRRFDGHLPVDPVLLDALVQADAVLGSMPPAADGDPALPLFADALAANPRLRWLGYLSSTGVYADRRGGIVDASSIADGTDATARARLMAEAQWRGLAQRRGIACGVFRLAGIYGPGRNALRQLAEGTARHWVKPGLVFNRIHVEDACDAITGSLWHTRTPDATYLLADGCPAPPQDVLVHAAALSGLPLPPARRYDAALASPALRRFYGASKRIDARQTQEALHWRPRHADYRQGLAALWRAGEGHIDAG
jgi:nucleoside-diphosphate-sugar epimerase